jgi:phosphopantothenoylcysteine synthetase/decarboxylase
LSLVCEKESLQIFMTVANMTLDLKDRTIILGVTGSIAAYKAADITSRLTEAGAKVFPVMTSSACRFIQPLTLQVLSRNPVASDMWQEGEGWQPGHIELADQADLLLVAPATAQCLGLFAQGLAPDLLSSIHLATQAPVMLAPAMNGKMLAHAATQANIETLRSRGYHFIAPQSGMLACGYEGDGKLAAVETIVRSVLDFFASV